MFNGTNKIDIQVKHLEDTVIVFEGPTVGKCDRAIWVRKDWYDNHDGEECASADHWKVEDRRMLHVDADQGSHVVQGPGLRNSTTISLEGCRVCGPLQRAGLDRAPLPPPPGTLTARAARARPPLGAPRAAR